MAKLKLPPTLNNPTHAGTVYSAHRARQRNRILAAAESLFAERGMDRVTMGELTVASGVQPSTMYQYFSNKDDVIWAMVGRIMASVGSDSKRAETSGKSGLTKITAFLDYMADELSNQPAQVRLMAQFDAIYARDLPVERLLEVEAEAGGLRRDVFRELIKEGIADGSLRSDLDPELTLEAVMNAAIGTQRRLASLDKKIEREYGQPIDRLFRETIRILLCGLRSTDEESGKPVDSAKRKRATRRRGSP